MATPRPFSGPFAPSEADLSQCVRCGLCLQHCPTFVQTGLEAESPRGRLYLIRALSEGLIEATPNVVEHLDMCLQCRNCEAVCPSGVPYGRIMERARFQVAAGDRAPLAWRLRRFFLREIIARPRRLALLATLLRVYRASGVRALAERTPGLRGMVVLAPTISGRPFSGRGLLARPEGVARHRVGLLIGCMMPLAYPRVHEATVRVLARNECVVNAPGDQVCCGALHAHNGDLETAMRLARRNIDAFLDEPCDAIVVNSAGCGAAMKEYGDLLEHDEDYRERAREVSSLVKDVNEYLVELPWAQPQSGVGATVTYQDSCHLAHAQLVSKAPRELLDSIPGLRRIEMEHADRCCGSAGVYSLTQRQMSLALLEEKLDSIEKTGATIVATANPGCMTQLEAGMRRRGLPTRVVHVVELLDEAYADSVPSRA